MKKIGYFFAAATTLVLPILVSAQGTGFQADGGEFGDFLGNILIFAETVLIPFIIGIGFLVFVWGMFQYFIAGGSDDESKAKGKSLLIYATLGFVLIIVFWGIINLLVGGTGLDDGGLDSGLIPSIGVPTQT